MKPTEQSLLEQMKMSDVEISHRMKFLGLSTAELNILFSHKQLIEDNIEIIVDEFYQKQAEVEGVSLLIENADTLTGLRSVQRKYVMDLFSGVNDREYVDNRLRVGLVHKRIRVEPKHYLSAVRTLKSAIVKTLKKTLKNGEALDETIEALDKLIYFDSTLVFDTYIDSLLRELEDAKSETDSYAKSLEEKVAQRTLQLEQLAQKDPLTNLYNRRAMQEFLKRDLATTKRRKIKLSLVYFDVDNFKDINDTQGHLGGDEVLKNIAKFVLNNIRSSDVPCRHGGDEFCIILPDCDITGAKDVCQKIIKEFEAIYPHYSISMGISEEGGQAYISGDTLINKADKKMYLAKKVKGSYIQTLSEFDTNEQNLRQQVNDHFTASAR